MRMQSKRGGKRVARLGLGALAEQDFGEMQHGREVPRLELERAPDVVQAFVVASKQIVERRALVPGLGVARRGAQERAEASLGNVVTFSSDVARRRVEHRGCRAV